MTITDDRGVEREVRVGDTSARDAALAGFLMLLHVMAFTIMPAFVFGLSYFGSRWVLVYLEVGDADGLGTLSFAVAITMVAVVMYARQVAINRSANSKKVDTPRCLGCRYDLSGLNIEPDGCRVCPECGGAWRVASGGGGS